MNSRRTLLVYPSVLWLTTFSLFPLALILVASFLRNGTVGPIEYALTLDNYLSVASRPEILSSVVKSFAVAAMISCGLIMMALPFVASIVMIKRFKSLVLFMFMVPFFSNTVLRLSALTYLTKDSGVVNSVLLFLGVVSSPFEMMYSRGAMILGFAYIYFPFSCLPLYVAHANHDGRLETVGRDLGLSEFQVLIRIKLPVVRQGLYNSFALVFLLILGDFYTPLIMEGGRRLYLSTIVFDQFTSARNWAYGSALSVVLLFGGLALSLLIVSVSEFTLFRKCRHALV